MAENNNNTTITTPTLEDEEKNRLGNSLEMKNP